MKSRKIIRRLTPRIKMTNRCTLFYLSIITLLVSNIGCQQAPKNTGDIQEKPKTVARSRPSAEEHLVHYWENILTDSLTKDSLVQRLVNYISIFPYVEEVRRNEIITDFLSNQSKQSTAFPVIVETFEHYLYDPNSPVHNDLFYEPILTYIVDSTKLSKADLYRSQLRLNLIKKNKVGAAAQDFSFMTADGKHQKLYDIEAPYILLFFYEPGCPHCERALDNFQQHPGFQALVNEQKLQPIGIYPDGERTIWESYQASIPSNWINGLDTRKEILTKDLYDLKASPTIYLLNQQKMVLLKDTDLERVYTYFYK